MNEINKLSPFVIFRVIPPKSKGELSGFTANDEVLMDRLELMELEESTEKHDLLHLEFDNADLTLLDSDLLTIDSTILLKFGYPGAQSAPRSLVIKAVKGFTKLSIECVGSAINMAEGRKSKTFVPSGVPHSGALTYSHVAEAVIRTAGFNPVVTPTKAPIEQVVQKNETDWQFLVRLAKLSGYEVTQVGGDVIFGPKDTEKPPVMVLWWRGDSAETDIIGEPKLDDTALTRPRKQKAKGQIKGGHKSLSESVDYDQAGGDTEWGGRIYNGAYTYGRQWTPNGDVSLASAAARDALREAMNPAPNPSIIMNYNLDNPPMQGPQIPSENVIVTAEKEAQMAQAIAKAMMRTMQDNKTRLELTCYGHPLLTKRMNIVLMGVGTRYSGPWYIRECVHKIGSDGWKTDLRLSRNAIGKPQGEKTKSNDAPEAKPSPKPQTKNVTIMVGPNKGTTKEVTVEKGK